MKYIHFLKKLFITFCASLKSMLEIENYYFDTKITFSNPIFFFLPTIQNTENVSQKLITLNKTTVQNQSAK